MKSQLQTQFRLNTFVSAESDIKFESRNTSDDPDAHIAVILDTSLSIEFDYEETKEEDLNDSTIVCNNHILQDVYFQSQPNQKLLRSTYQQPKKLVDELESDEAIQMFYDSSDKSENKSLGNQKDDQFQQLDIRKAFYKPQNYLLNSAKQKIDSSFTSDLLDSVKKHRNKLMNNCFTPRNNNSMQIFSSYPASTSSSNQSDIPSQKIKQHQTRVKIFDWYFYPEYADRKLFKGSHNQPKFSELFKICQSQLNNSVRSIDNNSEVSSKVSFESFKNPPLQLDQPIGFQTPAKKLKISLLSQPLVIVKSVQKISEKGLRKSPSILMFEHSELGLNFRRIFNDQCVPFKYRTIKHMQLILHCKECESDIRDFKVKESRVRRAWRYECLIDRDLMRTNNLKDNLNLHIDTKRVIEFYCNSLNVSYCQGMLEVLLPFMYMKHTGGTTGHGDFDIACVYAYFKRFVRNFIPNNLHSKFNGRTNVLPYIKCTLHLTELLLAYHDRELYGHLKRRLIPIEIYAASWVTTLFSRVVEFSMIYELWEIFLFERDQYFIFYFSVGIIKMNRDKILKLKTFDSIVKLMQRLFIKDLADLAEVYRLAIEIRKCSPVSFQALCESIGIFTFNPIISNEELELVENVNLKEVMPIYSLELLMGSSSFLSQQPTQNNEKFKNLLFLSENEQQIYFTADIDQSQQQESLLKDESVIQMDQTVKVIDPLFKINSMKLMTSADLKVATQVKFTLLDLRVSKKPRLTEIFKQTTVLGEESPIVVEVDGLKVNSAKDLETRSDRHLVVILQESIESPYPNRAAELEIFKRVNEALLKNQQYVSLLTGGAKELFRQRERLANR